MEFIKALYIDPGTGGMLFTVIFGLFGVVIFAFRTLIMKMKFRTSGNKDASINNRKIPIVIFAESKRYWNIFEPLLDEFEKRKQKITYLTGSEDDPVFNKGYKYISGEYAGEGNKVFSRLNTLNATVLLSTTPSLDVFQWKRSKNVGYYIYISHNPNDITMYRMFALDHYDALILSGEYQKDQARQLEELRNEPAKDIELCGLPFMDVLKKRLEAAGPVPEHEKTVLLAPTWGENGLLTRYGERFIDALIETGYKIIVRPHPQSFTTEKEMMDRLMAKYVENPKFSWNRDTDNFEVLRQSDILISDFSGVIFDYALVFDKPVIYTDTNIDLGPFDAYWLEETPWTLRILPKLGLELNEEKFGNIKEVIDNCIDDPSFASGREEARSETWVNIGEGTVRSVDYVLKKYNEVCSREKRKENKAKKPEKRGLFKAVSTEKNV